MSLPHTWLRQIRRLAPILAMLYLPLFVGFLGLSLQTRVEPALLMLDPAAAAGLPFYTGVISNLGLLLWASTGAICLLTARLLTKSKASRGDVRFFFCSGGLSLLLLFDDLLLLHESVYPRLLMIPEKVTFVVYGLLVITYLFKFRNHILRYESVLLALALSLLAKSMFLDLIVETQYLGEDAFKFAGIATWFVYFSRACLRQLENLMAFEPLPSYPLNRR